MTEALTPAPDAAQRPGTLAIQVAPGIVGDRIFSLYPQPDARRVCRVCSFLIDLHAAEVDI